MTIAFRIRAAILLAPLLFAAFPIAAQPLKNDGIALTLLSGETRQAKSIAISAGKLTGEGLQLPLDDLRQIRIAAVVSEAKPAVVLHLLGGGKVFDKSIAIASDECQVESALAGKL